MLILDVVGIIFISLVKDKKKVLNYLLVLNGIYLFYYFILGAMYIFSMPWEEAKVLAGYTRYMMTIVDVIIGLFIVYIFMYKGKIKKEGFIQADDVYVDGNRIGDVSNAVIKDRKLMANDGIIIVVANIDTKEKKLLGNPNITTRGFVLVNENEELLKNLENVSKKAINSMLDRPINYTEIKSEIINELSNYTYQKTGRKPIILPVIMDIKR